MSQLRKVPGWAATAAAAIIVATPLSQLMPVANWSGYELFTAAYTGTGRHTLVAESSLHPFQTAPVAACRTCGGQ